MTDKVKHYFWRIGTAELNLFFLGKLFYAASGRAHKGKAWQIVGGGSVWYPRVSRGAEAAA